MTAHQRFVIGVRLLLAAACLLLAGRVMWKRVETHDHRQITTPCLNAVAVGVVDSDTSAAAGEPLATELEPARTEHSARVEIATGVECDDTTTFTETTPNHAPALAMIVLGVAVAISGVALARSHPAEPNESASDNEA